MANEGYRTNSNLKSAGQEIEFTQEQIEEYVKCSQDFFFFCENYVKIINVDDGLVPFKLFNYQKRMLKEVNDNRNCVILAPRQSGKCFDSHSHLRLRNKTTGEIIETTVGDFYNSVNENIS